MSKDETIDNLWGRIPEERGLTMTEFESGALIALATLNAVFDQPSMCASTINELGLNRMSED